MSEYTDVGEALDREFHLRQQVVKGEAAELALHDEALSTAFARLESDYLRAWGATTDSETSARENIWRAIQILGDVRKHLTIIAQNGKLAKSELDRIRNGAP